MLHADRDEVCKTRYRPRNARSGAHVYATMHPVIPSFSQELSLDESDDMMMRMSDPSSKSESELSDDEVGHFVRIAWNASGVRLISMRVGLDGPSNSGDRVADRVIVNSCIENFVKYLYICFYLLDSAKVQSSCLPAQNGTTAPSGCAPSLPNGNSSLTTCGCRTSVTCRCCCGRP